MKRGVIFLSSCFLFAHISAAGTLNEGEIIALKTEITSMLTSFEKGDAQALIDRTHASIYKLVGGREAFEQVLKQAVEQLLQTGVKVLESELGTPTQVYSAGSEEVCFVPRVSVMEIQGKRVKSTSFMIAIRKTNGGTWKYLDGAGLRRNPGLLATLLPDLSEGIELPPNKMELQ